MNSQYKDKASDTRKEAIFMSLEGFYNYWGIEGYIEEPRFVEITGKINIGE